MIVRSERAAHVKAGIADERPFGQVLLDGLADYVRRFVVVTSEQADALALWVIHTHAYEAFDCSPLLVISSAEKRSGKSRLLDVLELVVARAWMVIRPSEAVTYRKIARDRPTLMLDETDTIFGKGNEHEGLRALLNAGNKRGVAVPRCAGPQHDRLEEFEVYCPKVLAGIGRLPDTVEDRAISIRLKRRTRAEPIQRFRRRNVTAEAEELHANAAAWAEAGAHLLEQARPELPEELDDRAWDFWEPLLAIADLAGGEWRQRARRAAVKLAPAEERDEDSLSVRLLMDVRSAFDGDGGDRLATAVLLLALTADEEAPWATFGKADKPLNAHALARLLRPFGIRSRTIRLADGTTPKGFLRDQFEDAWSRYAPVESPAEPQHRRNPHEQRVSAAIQSAKRGGAETGANPHGYWEAAVLPSVGQVDGRSGAGAAPQEEGEPGVAESVDQAEIERLAERARAAQRENSAADAAARRKEEA